jgi:hypothetical protein
MVVSVNITYVAIGIVVYAALVAVLTLRKITGDVKSSKKDKLSDYMGKSWEKHD